MRQTRVQTPRWESAQFGGKALPNDQEPSSLMTLDPLEHWLVQPTGGDARLVTALQIFIVVLTVVVFNFFLRRMLKTLEDRTRLTTTPWDFALVSAARKPVTALAWIVGIAFASRIVQAETRSTLFEAIDPARTVGVIGCITWFLIRFIKNVQDGVMVAREARGEGVDHTTVQKWLSPPGTLHMAGQGEAAALVDPLP